MRTKLVIFSLLLALALSACGVQPAAEVPSVTSSPEPSRLVRVTEAPTLAPFDVAAISMQSTPDSSCFSSVGYDGNYEVLAVVFRDSGAEYIYYDFSPADWDSFISADSLGSYFNSYIKPYYEYEKIG